MTRWNKQLIVFSFTLSVALFLIVYGINASEPGVGEKFTYGIYIGGIYVGYQTIEIESITALNGTDVYTVRGHSKSAPVISLFYNLDDKWLLFINKQTLLPIRIEKDMVEGKHRGFLIYDIDQENRLMTIFDQQEGKNRKLINLKNDVYDIISLFFFFKNRENEKLYETITIDFLASWKVKTVTLAHEGTEVIKVPPLSGRPFIPAHKYKQVGGYEIEFFVSDDPYSIPLKMFVHRKYTIFNLPIEVFLKEYKQGNTAILS